MGKPHYPAHVFRQLIKYPRLTCEECGTPILPRLDKPRGIDKKPRLESIGNFKRKRFCSHSCANRASQRKRQAAQRRPTPDDALKGPENPDPVGKVKGPPRPAPIARRATPGQHLEPATRRLLRDALNRHDGPDFPLAEFFQPTPGGTK